MSLNAPQHSPNSAHKISETFGKSRVSFKKHGRSYQNQTVLSVKMNETWD